MKRTPAVLAVFAATAALAFAGCGDDGGEEPEPLTGATGATGVDGAEIETKEDFVAAADQICKEQEKAGAREIQAALPANGQPSQDEQIELAETIVIPNLQAQHDQIAALPQPEGEEDAINDILDKLQAGIDEFSDDPTAVFTEGDTSQAIEEANDAARAYGLEECGS